MNPTKLDIVREMREQADAFEADRGVIYGAAAGALLRQYADKFASADDWPYQFTLEQNYEDAKSCLADAKLVAVEREYHGVARLVDHALGCLETIGRLSGINGQRLIDFEREVAK